MSNAPAPKLTEAEYLALEAEAEHKSEFVNGELVAMSAVSVAHSIVTGNLQVALAHALRPRGCRVHSSDLRVTVSETGLYAYPDLSVVCGPMQLGRGLSVTRPRAIPPPTSPSRPRASR